jgi:hypothetical protein
VVVTAAFNYRGPHLIDFFRRYDLASPAEHGVDDSVSMPSDLEADAARAVLDPDVSGPLVKFAVNSSQDDNVAVPLIGLDTRQGGAGTAAGAHDVVCAASGVLAHNDADIFTPIAMTLVQPPTAFASRTMMIWTTILLRR